MKKTLQKRPVNSSELLDGCTALLTRIYRSRGVSDVSELDRQLSAMLPYDNLMDIQKACERMTQSIQHQEKVIIIGDYDTDGATSTALMVRMLKAFGLQQVDFLVPNRFEYGYGLSPKIVEVASKKSPQLLITVDNGIVSFDGVNLANSLGIDVIITDHHLPGASLPNACAVVNPNRLDDPFPSKNLAGVGVAFYVMVALRAYLREKQWFTKKNTEPSLAQVLDLVALGTVADLVPLDKNNRLLVHQGLLRIQQGAACPGIQALISVSGKLMGSLSASDLGFALAPRLNAVGRLDDMTHGIQCLLSQNLEDAMPMAQSLDAMNIERRTIEKSMKAEADQIINDEIKLANDAPGVCLFQSHWHQGVVGLVASRVKDKVNRPVVVFAKASDDSDELKGSCRSILSVHIRDLLAKVAGEHPGLMDKFGGHAMAAGLSIKAGDYETFKRLFMQACAEALGGINPNCVLETDGKLQSSEIQMETAKMLASAGPWGQGFPEPLFEGRFILLDQRLVGGHHLKMSLQPYGTSIVVEAIAFFVELKLWPNQQCREINAAYRLDVNTYLGRSRLQLLMEYFEPI